MLLNLQIGGVSHVEYCLQRPHLLAVTTSTRVRHLRDCFEQSHVLVLTAAKHLAAGLLYLNWCSQRECSSLRLV